MNGQGSAVQTGLVSAGPLREDFRRFLELLGEFDPAVTVREAPFLIVAELAGQPLCECRPKAQSVHVRLGRAGGREVRCHSHEDFVAILDGLLADGRVAAGPLTLA